MSASPFVKFRRAQRRARGLLLSAWIRSSGGQVGARLEVERGMTMRWRPHRGIVLGNHVYLGIGVVLDVGRRAELVVGDDVKIMHYTVIAASRSVRIGPLTQIAEHCSIRDTDHGMELGLPMREQSLSTPTSIGRDAWIGRGSAVLRGSTVGDGAAIGANSVVRGDVPALSVAVGSPARVVRKRI